MDPLAASFPWYTPYQFAGNKPIRFIDLDGAEEFDNMWQMFMDYILGHSALNLQKSEDATPEERVRNSREFITVALDESEKLVEAYDNTYGFVLPFYSAGLSAIKGDYTEAIVLSVLDVGTVGKGKVATKVLKEVGEEVVEEGSKTIYRAIGVGELIDIVEKRALDFKEGMVEAKYFSESLEAAANQAAKNPSIKDNYLVISVELPKKIYDKLYKSTHIDNFEDVMDGAETIVIQGRNQLDEVNSVIKEIKVIGKKVKE